jgi:hypothetical protein
MRRHREDDWVWRTLEREGLVAAEPPVLLQLFA